MELLAGKTREGRHRAMPVSAICVVDQVPLYRRAVTARDARSFAPKRH
jgi:hypothetical protein